MGRSVYFKHHRLHYVILPQVYSVQRWSVLNSCLHSTSRSNALVYNFSHITNPCPCLYFRSITNPCLPACLYAYCPVGPVGNLGICPPTTRPARRRPAPPGSETRFIPVASKRRVPIRQFAQLHGALSHAISLHLLQLARMQSPLKLTKLALILFLSSYFPARRYLRI